MSTGSLLIKCHSLTKEASPCMDRAINASLDWLHDAFGCSLMHWHRCPWGDRGKGGEGFRIRTLHPGYPARVDEVLACIPAAVSHWPALLSKAICLFSLWWISGLPICCRYCNRRKGRIECSSLKITPKNFSKFQERIANFMDLDYTVENAGKFSWVPNLFIVSKSKLLAF